MIKMSDKGEVLIEFLVLIIILMGLFLLVTMVAGQKNTGFLYFQDQAKARQIAEKIAGTVNHVFLAGNGTQATLLLENDFNYSVQFAQNSVQVHWKNQFADATLHTSQITAQEILPGTEILVSNSNGGITIEPA